MTTQAQAMPAGSTRRTWGRRLRGPEAFSLFLLAPAILTLVFVILYPVLTALNLSFRKVDIYSPGVSEGPFTLANYARLFASAAFWQAVRVSVAYVVLSVGFALLIGFGTALLLNQPFRGRTVARMLAVLPWAVPSVVAANIWWWILDPSYGLLNFVLLRLGLVSLPVNWVASPRPALAAISIVTVWKGYPFFTVMVLAGLQAIPKDLYDAAAVDGGGAFAAFRFVTVPGLRNILALATLLSVLWVFREFTYIWVLTGGGPVRATETLAVMTYREAFTFFHMGFAAAIGVVTLAISTVASILFIRQSGQEFY
ncbi:MAG TPA: sugar ABC transporter permease [bacterium]|nr:sugar ABC transporter permease [bacterium]